jgi:hypothetical protein
MESLDQILQKNPDFEPSKVAKQSVIASAKQDDLTHEGLEVVIPSFFSLDVSLFGKKKLAPYLVFMLEIVAIAGIFNTNSNPYFLLARLTFAVGLWALDFWLARKINAPLEQLAFAKYRNKRFELVRKYFGAFYSDERLAEIATSYHKNEEDILKAERTMSNSVRRLWLLAILKIVVFSSELFAGMFGFIEEISLVGIEVLWISFFFATIVAYLAIPLIAKESYGPWFSINKASEFLNADLRAHLEDRSTRSRDLVGRVQYWRRKETRRLTLATLVSESIQLGESPGGVDNLNPTGESAPAISFDPDSSRANYRVYYDEVQRLFLLEINGILTDNDLQTMVANQSNLDSKKFLLCMGMQMQLACAVRDGDVNISRENPIDAFPAIVNS